ncbi:hypothetical protein GE21DRAFT_8884 [Neurospora crassa]|uniref:Uncharacterized protein n=1 Tax=Neurospora crassa (strain ATCC 24698 / 74-OR23-1A / CBS 708.71 / DSM 1257 / FGSC 987) TaxID=367110 RepID=Q7S5X8_NEUCR|nr:hypothetical protein NCU05628 [Neurospora crassa OR74A]EAA30936.1 hypothetical protein NCU05628 [Neurospora crassa OR74A]KHE80570.1 hypothetical protein GE21DRAFT_8884 [Neurospora crassa]|eukprot:XP_960172.1 hypothetical protein NCU05628 [Neurospora crassa OR74A]
MASKNIQEASPGQIYAKIVDDAQKIMRQFNTPVASANLLNKITERELSTTTAPAEWNTYHQMTNLHRLQLETLFGMIHSVDENACSGWQPQGTWTSTVVTVGTYGAKAFTYDGKKQLAAQLVSNEGIASLKADFDLILKLVTKLTELPTPKKAQ